MLFHGKKSLFILLVFCCSSLVAESELFLPLGLHWSSSKESLLKTLATKGGKVLKKTHSFDGEEIIVTGLPGKGLKQSIFLYDQGKLTAIEYQYGLSSWKEREYDQFFDNFKNLLEQKYGLATILNKGDKPLVNEQGIEYLLKDSQWRQSSLVLDLCYFKAKKGKDFYYNVSLHYKKP